MTPLHKRPEALATRPNSPTPAPSSSSASEQRVDELYAKIIERNARFSPGLKRDDQGRAASSLRKK